MFRQSQLSPNNSIKLTKFSDIPKFTKLPGYEAYIDLESFNHVIQRYKKKYN